MAPVAGAGSVTPRRPPRARPTSVAAVAWLSAACGARHVTHAAAIPQVDCVAFESLISEPYLVVGQIQLSACPLARSRRDAAFTSWVRLPIETLPPGTRLSARDPEVTLVALGPGPGDADTRYVRLDFPGPASAASWFDASAPRAARASSYAPPEGWPLHPGSSDPDEQPPAWWPSPGAAGEAVVVQHPSELGPCITRAASGEIWLRSARTVWIYAWYRQWLGGCGG